MKELFTAAVLFCLICPYFFIALVLAFLVIGLRMRKEYPKASAVSFVISAATAGFTVFSFAAMV